MISQEGWVATPRSRRPLEGLKEMPSVTVPGSLWPSETPAGWLGFVWLQLHFRRWDSRVEERRVKKVSILL